MPPAETLNFDLEAEPGVGWAGGSEVVSLGRGEVEQSSGVSCIGEWTPSLPVSVPAEHICTLNLGSTCRTSLAHDSRKEVMIHFLMKA